MSGRCGNRTMEVLARLPVLAIGVALLSSALPCQRAHGIGLPEAGPVVMPNSKQFELRSQAGRDYRVFVAWPPGMPPTQGFPVIYALDANSVFGTLVETLRIQQRYPPITGVSPALVVGIGYPVAGPFDQQRRALDFVSGPDEFLSFIETQLRPLIDSEFKIDQSRQTLFGHSSGGYFVLHTLFKRPRSFQTYVAVSPDPSDPRLEQQFMRELSGRCEKEARRPIRILLSAAEYERTLSPVMLKLPAAQREARQAAMRADDRVAKARMLARRLAKLAPCGLEVNFIEFAGENHASVLPAAINRMLPCATNAGCQIPSLLQQPGQHP